MASLPLIRFRYSFAPHSDGRSPLGAILHPPSLPVWPPPMPTASAPCPPTRHDDARDPLFSVSNPHSAQVAARSNDGIDWQEEWRRRRSSSFVARPRANPDGHTLGRQRFRAHVPGVLLPLLPSPSLSLLLSSPRSPSPTDVGIDRGGGGVGAEQGEEDDGWTGAGGLAEWRPSSFPLRQVFRPTSFVSLRRRRRHTAPLASAAAGATGDSAPFPRVPYPRSSFPSFLLILLCYIRRRCLCPSEIRGAPRT